MSRLLRMPMTEEMVEGSLIRWCKKQGEMVTKGEEVAEIGAEEIRFFLKSPFDGILQEIKVQVGAKVEIGDVVAVISEESEIIGEVNKTELIVESLKCGNCGASLSLKNTTCGYCGSDNIIRKK